MNPSIRTVLSRLVEQGAFGTAGFVALETEPSLEVGAQFSSSLSLLRLTVSGSSGRRALSIVVKQPTSDSAGDVMFHNEAAMYAELLPGLGVGGGDSYPKMYHGTATGLLVLENMNRKGFVLSRQRVFLDFDHVALAVQKIAEFHSSSYLTKHKDTSRFLQMTEKLKKVNFTNIENLKKITFAAMERGIKPLLKENIAVELLNKCLNLLKDPYEVRRLISTPEEPYAVICHGDFCNNNIFFKYDSGRPVDCAFFDFQLSKYASPAIDLFFFFYMHTSSPLRETNWDDFLKIYWDTLRSKLPQEVEIPSFQDYLKHFGQRAIYGYIISSWFLPVLMDHHPVSEPDYTTLSIDEKIKRFLAVAGEEGDQVNRDVVLHLLDKGYIDDFINFCNEKNYNP